MKPAAPYLFFNGNCKEALSYYRDCFTGELQTMTFGDVQKDACPVAMKDKIMHGSVVKGDFLLMASDTPEGNTPVIGGNVHIALTFDSRQETDRIYAKLSEKGSADYPLHDAFWGDYFGTLTDRYGVHWMISCPSRA